MLVPKASEENGDAAIELATCDLSALATEDFKHWVSTAVVQCMMATDAGPRIDRGKLGDLVERHFDHLIDGNRFDFSPVLAALCRVKGVSETNLYIGVVNLQQRLASLNIEMAIPDMKLDQWTRAQLLREAHEATETARQEREQARLRGAVQELHRARLGDLLVQQRLIDETELAEALENQERAGGRLGSNLVQLGFVNEADLARFLGRQLGLPCVTGIKYVPHDARRAVPQELLLKYRIVPLAVDQREIPVAMVDPTDLVCVDEVSFVTGRRVRPVVAPELVVDFARARFFGIRRAPRLLASQDAPNDGPPAFPRSMFDRNPVVLPAPDEEPYDLSELAHELMTCEVEDDVFGPLWRLMTEHFHLVARLSVDRGLVQGDRIIGASEARAASFAKAQVPACSHPVLDEVLRDKKPYAGECDRPVGSQWLCEHLGLSAAAFVWIVPVRSAKTDVVALMIGHLPRGEPPESAWVEAVWTAAQAAMTMVGSRRTLRRVQTGGRPTVHRVESVV